MRLVGALMAALAASPVAACRAPPWGEAVSLSMVEAPSVDPAAFTRAWYADLTDIYGHGILGDALEPATLHAWSAETSARCGLSVAAGEGHVFEDVAPRLADLTGDGRPEVIAVRSSLTQGAQLVIYSQSADGLAILAATPYIGQPNRWLAPVGIADLDGDGRPEIAYVDRPHLARTLRIWRFADGALTEIAAASGLTNHRIGEVDIGGGIRTCGDGPEMILATQDWARIVAVTLSDGALVARDIGPHRGRASFAAALACEG